MTKLWIISLPMLLLPVLTGCKGKTTSDPQQPATDSIQQTATATDSVRADTATEATTDEMRHIKKDVYAITKERIEGYDDFISSRKSFDLEWPEDVAACQNLSSLQQRLIKWMFEKKAQGTIDQIIKKKQPNRCLPTTTNAPTLRSSTRINTRLLSACRSNRTSA